MGVLLHDSTVVGLSREEAERHGEDDLGRLVIGLLRVLDRDEVALLPRFEAPATAIPNASAARATVNRQYQLVTPETVAQASF